MKKIFSLFFALWLSLSMAATAFAADTTSFFLDELDMSIDIPNEYITFTRDTGANDPNFGYIGFTQQEMLSFMEDNSIYLNALSKDINFEILVTMTEFPGGDFSLLSDTTLLGLSSSLDGAFADQGIEFIKAEVYQHHQAKFLKIYISQPGNTGTVYGLQYYTMYNGKAIHITLHSYYGAIDNEKERILQSIVDSAYFESAPASTDPPAATAAFTYRDEETGLTFTVPANWVETPFTKDREFIDVKFCSTLEEGATIIYGGEDLWSMLSSSERAGYSRSTFDNSFSTADIAQEFGVAESDIRIVQYGGREYYKFSITGSTTAYGLDFSIETSYHR